MNKPVKIRSSMFCKNDKICSVCAGKRFYILGIQNIGLTSGRVTNTLLNASMKNFHNAKHMSKMKKIAYNATESCKKENYL